MHRVLVSKTIEGSSDRVWDVLDNFAETSVYHPVVADSGSTNGQQRGLQHRRGKLPSPAPPGPARWLRSSSSTCPRHASSSRLATTPTALGPARSAYLIGALGAERFCQMYSGGRVEERIIAYDAAARTYEVTVTDHGPFPLKAMTVDISVADAGADKSVVTFAADFQPKFGPMGWVTTKVIMKGQFSKMLQGVVDGLEDHVRSGQTVGKGGALELAKAA